MLPVAILAGGLATRLRPLTDTLPKAMIEICGAPFVDWQLKLLAKNGVGKVVFCVAYKSEMIQDFVGDGSKYGIDVTYSEDGPSLLGTGGAIRGALPRLGADFMVLYGDSYLPIDYKAVETAFYSTPKPALMTVYRNGDLVHPRNVIFVQGELRKYDKGFPDEGMAHIDYGLSIFDASVFMPYSNGAKIDLAEICTTLSSAGLLAGYEVQERFYEIGSLRGIRDFTAYIERNRNVL